MVLSVLNDAITKYINLHFIQITFCRFLVGSFIIITIKYSQLYYKKNILKKFYNELGAHIYRSVLLFLSTILWAYGVSLTPLTLVTTISFCIPIFVLILSNLLLVEGLIWHRWISAFIGLIGITIALPLQHDFTTQEGGIILLISALGFACLDIMNKKAVNTINLISIILYSSIWISILSFVPVLFIWKTPSLLDLLLLFLLGVNSNLIFFLLLKAYFLHDISALSTYRYLELSISALLGYLMFQEIPSFRVFIGGITILLTTIISTHFEKKQIKFGNHPKK